MTEKIKQFFDELVDHGHQPLLGKVRGTVRFDLLNSDGEVDHWLVAIDHGNVRIGKAPESADCTIRGDMALFERLITGEENAIAATLRGELVCTGNAELLFAIQRLFPGPPRKRKMVGEAMGST